MRTIIAVVLVAVCNTANAQIISESVRRQATINACIKAEQNKTSGKEIFAVIEGIYQEKYLKYFIGAYNVGHACQIMQRIHQEESDRERSPELITSLSFSLKRLRPS